MIFLIPIGKSPFQYVSIWSKQDIQYYIAARLEIKSLADDKKLFTSNISHVRIADILLSIGLSDENSKEKCIKALKSILLIKNISDTSYNVIKNNTIRPNFFIRKSLYNRRGYE